ncbi:hypothetical protein Hanom_Chr06g00575011 [Helianthus anomalus]
MDRVEVVDRRVERITAVRRRFGGEDGMRRRREDIGFGWCHESELNKKASIFVGGLER